LSVQLIGPRSGTPAHRLARWVERKPVTLKLGLIGYGASGACRGSSEGRQHREPGFAAL
jgi:hypothetical protein